MRTQEIIHWEILQFHIDENCDRYLSIKYIKYLMFILFHCWDEFYFFQKEDTLVKLNISVWEAVKVLSCDIKLKWVKHLICKFPCFRHNFVFKRENYRNANNTSLILPCPYYNRVLKRALLQIKVLKRWAVKAIKQYPLLKYCLSLCGDIVSSPRHKIIFSSTMEDRNKILFLFL